MTAKVLRLLREDSKSWWYFKSLRERGQISKAVELERKSILSAVNSIRVNISRKATTHRVSVIEFLDRPQPKPFDFKTESINGWTMMVSSCHCGHFAAWVYCYANRIGWKPKAKVSDLI